MLKLDGVGAFRVERFNDLRLIPLIEESNVSLIDTNHPIIVINHIIFNSSNKAIRINC